MLDLTFVATPEFDSLAFDVAAATGWELEKSSWFRARYKRYASAEEARRSYDTTRGWISLRGGKIAADEAIAEVVAGLMTPEREARLLAEWQAVSPTLPRPAVASIAAVADLRRELGPDASKSLYAMLDSDRNGVIMCQLRIDEANGKKKYIPYSYLSGQGSAPEWINSEPWCMPGSTPDAAGNFPEFRLPFWKPAHRRNCDRVMIHEGAKVAWFIDHLVNNHDPYWQRERAKWPAAWLDYVSGFEHWGIIGGARSPHRSNYKELQAMRALLVVYVCDRDPAGESAAREVTRHYQKQLDYMKFSEDIFPIGFDLADPLPAPLFHDGVCTTAIQAFLNPGTWATECVVPKSKGQKAIYDVTVEFLSDWRYVQMPGLFVHERFPNVTYGMDDFNLKMLALSHVGRKTGDLFLMHLESQIPLVTYDPSKPSGSIKMGHETKGHIVGFNTYIKPRIEPCEHSDIGFWFEFMEHMFAVEDDRIEVYRWIYTLLVHPEIRMGYGLLLYSQTQGVGKTMLFEHILMPLIGQENTSSVREDDVFSEFTSWRHNKRLVYINEIHNKNGTDKMYNFLKEVITDKQYLHNEKRKPTYNQDSWLHVMASSNDNKALKLDRHDRRWLIPKVSEKVLDPAFAHDFVWWLKGPGLPAILAHAHAWFEHDGAEAVRPGAHAPDTSARRAMIEDSLSPGQRLVRDTLDLLLQKYPLSDGVPIVTADVVLIDLIYRRLHHRGTNTNYLEKARTVRNTVGEGWYWGKSRLFFPGLDFKGSIRGSIVSNDPATARLTLADLKGKNVKLFLTGKEIEDDLGLNQI